METSHAVLWSDRDGPPLVGALEIAETGLQLRGWADGDVRRCQILPDQIARVHIDRSSDERLRGQLTLVVDRFDDLDRIRIAAVNGAGVLFEIADLVAELASGQPETGHVVVVVLPIKPGRDEAVARLVEAGPPFDPAAVDGLEHHEVFVAPGQVIFTFQGRDVRRAIEQLARAPSVWKSALAWRECLAGRPHLVEPAYSWTRPMPLRR